MKIFVLDFEKAQAIFNAVATLPIPYTQSRPIIELLETGKASDAKDLTADLKSDLGPL